MLPCYPDRSAQPLRVGAQGWTMDAMAGIKSTRLDWKLGKLPPDLCAPPNPQQQMHSLCANNGRARP